MKQLLLFTSLVSFSASSQRMDPILLQGQNINSIGGSSIIFNSGSSLGLDSFDNTVTGLNELHASKILIYPNPSSNYLNIGEVSGIVIYDECGRLVDQFNTDKIDVSGFHGGTYFLTINNSNLIKFIKL